MLALIYEEIQFYFKLQSSEIRNSVQLLPPFHQLSKEEVLGFLWFRAFSPVCIYSPKAKMGTDLTGFAHECFLLVGELRSFWEAEHLMLLQQCEQ